MDIEPSRSGAVRGLNGLVSRRFAHEFQGSQASSGKADVRAKLLPTALLVVLVVLVVLLLMLVLLLGYLRYLTYFSCSAFNQNPRHVTRLICSPKHTY